MEKTEKQKKHEERNDKAKLIAKMQQKKSGSSNTSSSQTTSNNKSNKPSGIVDKAILKKVQDALMIVFFVVGLLVAIIAHPLQGFFFPQLSLATKCFMDVVLGIAVFCWLFTYYKKNIVKINEVIVGSVEQKSRERSKK